MDSHAEKFAKIAERIERELKRIDEAAVADARLEPVRARERGPHWLARVLSNFRHGLKAQPSAEDEGARRFEAAQLRLESLEKYGAELARAAAQQAANADEWERRAMLAVRAGDDDLARKALSWQREALERASTLERQAATISAAMAEYTSALAAIKASSR
ncbi:PspA/IM30 family protein [Sorangium sp. So ce693]|uniref:PspA/IM30 family protein n=1 Tax=Sorangium sp. So ce693 TaxID=3133318 RepID=UPI003F61DB9C